MKNWKVWVLTDKDGNELARGRKKDVTNVAYRRYVYQHIFTDHLYKTDELLIKQSRQALFFVVGAAAIDLPRKTIIPYSRKKINRKIAQTLEKI